MGPPMIREVTITSLEMTSDRELVPAAEPRESLDLEHLGPGDLDLFRSTCLRIGEPHGWTTRPAWSEAQWVERLDRADVDVWIARVGPEVAGIFELELQPGGSVEIVVLGLLPEFIGRGLGGHLLTVATQRAWRLRHPEGETTRVWLHTASYDHPHAIHNYRGRGFRVFARERRRHRVDPAIEAGVDRRSGESACR